MSREPTGTATCHKFRPGCAKEAARRDGSRVVEYPLAALRQGRRPCRYRAGMRFPQAAGFSDFSLEYQIGDRRRRFVVVFSRLPQRLPNTPAGCE